MIKIDVIYTCLVRNRDISKAYLNTSNVKSATIIRYTVRYLENLIIAVIRVNKNYRGKHVIGYWKISKAIRYILDSNKDIKSH